ncbi:MAG: CoA transferase [Salinarimonadaceae bacterium]|nr:MAG: CoA transferase [Salinarimonadaceae bacterium]
MSALQSNTGSIQGLRVIELTTMIAGPLCAQILADHGAEVIKVEAPQGDMSRDSPPHLAGVSSYFAGMNRNKRAISLDLTSAAGRAVLLRMLEKADVLLENSLPGTMERWSLGYDEVLSKQFPQLIHCSVTGFGADGPLGGRPGYDAVVQAYSGLMSINGQPESGTTRLGIAVVDMATGMNAAIGILLAVAERHRSGKGQRIEVTLFDSAMALLHPYAPNWFASGKTPGPVGNGHPNLMPYDKYAAQDGEIFIGTANDGQYQRLVAVLGRPDLATDPAFRTKPDRIANRERLDRELAPLIATRNAMELAEELMAERVPASPVQSVPQALNAPHTAHRKMRVRLENGYEGLGIPVKMTRSPGAIHTAPRTFAQDTDAVLAEFGISESEIAELEAAGVVRRERKKAVRN